MPPRKTARSNAEYRGAVVRPDPPDPSWAPLRHAPYRLQAVPQRLIGLRLQPPRLLERDEISDFVNTAISGTDIVKCELNEAGTGLVVTWKTEGYDSTSNETYDEEYPADLVPYNFRKLYHSPDEQTDDLITKVEAAWAEMERRLRIAITNSLCHVVARSGSMHAVHFTEISPSEFSLYKIVDWNHGLAESGAGEKLYSIYIEPNACRQARRNYNEIALALSPQEADLYKCINSRPKAKKVALYFLRNPPVGFPSATITQEVEKAVCEHFKESITYKTLQGALELAVDLANASPGLRVMFGIDRNPTDSNRA